MGEINIIEVEYGTKEVVAAELAGLRGNYSVLVLTRGPIYWDSLKSFMHVLLNEKRLSAVYVTANKPAQKVRADLEDALIKTEGIRFIDCVSKKGDKGVELSMPVVSGLNDALGNAVKKGAVGAVVIDSISALMLYNPENDVERFVHGLAAKTYEWKVAGVMFAVLSAQNAGFMERLAPVFDKVIKIMK